MRMIPYVCTLSVPYAGMELELPLQRGQLTRKNKLLSVRVYIWQYVVSVDDCIDSRFAVQRVHDGRDSTFHLKQKMKYISPLEVLKHDPSTHRVSTHTNGRLRRLLLPYSNGLYYHLFQFQRQVTKTMDRRTL